MMHKETLSITIVGLGYIGLPTAALLASRGHRIYGVDINQNAVDTINRGEIHIVEPDLDRWRANTCSFMCSFLASLLLLF